MATFFARLACLPPRRWAPPPERDIIALDMETAIVLACCCCVLAQRKMATALLLLLCFVE